MDMIRRQGDTFPCDDVTRLPQTQLSRCGYNRSTALGGTLCFRGGLWNCLEKTKANIRMTWFPSGTSKQQTMKVKQQVLIRITWSPSGNKQG